MHLDAAPTMPAPVRVTLAITTVVCAAIPCLVGLTVLQGWLNHDEGLRTLWSGPINIKANTALALTLSGLALLLLARHRPKLWMRIPAYVFASLVILIGTLTLSEHIFNYNLGIDELLFRELPLAPATQSPGRMGPPASICFPLLGIGLLLIDRKRKGGGPAGEPYVFLALVLAAVPIMGYVYQANQLYGLARFTGISLHTAICILLLGIGILAARPGVGLMRLIVSRDAGGMILRRMLPAAILLPVLIGLARVWGESIGLYSTEFGRAILVLAFTVSFSGLTWWTAAIVARHDAARARAEDNARTLQLQIVDALANERRARGAAEQANKMKDDFLATLSHELRTPLHAILGWAQVLDRLGLPSEAQQGIQSIERNARLQARLIEDLLDLSGIVSGKLSLEMQTVDLSQVIDAAVLAASPSAEAKSIKFEKLAERRVGMVRGDAARLQQVLWNLLTNAIKFTPEGGRVTVTLADVGGEAEVRVMDTGIGISDELLEAVFDRFRQANAPTTTRLHGGLGIGLSVARQLVELHHGTLRAASGGEGQGATFVIRLPVAEAVDPTPLPQEPKPLEGPRETRLAGLRILTVDDEPDARELVQHILNLNGAYVVTASSAAEALRLLDGGSRFDVLLSDIGMPDRDGYELLREIQSKFGDIPAIALTAFASEVDRDKSRKSGYRYHLAKPVQASELVATIAAAARPVPSARLVTVSQNPSAR